MKTNAPFSFGDLLRRLVEETAPKMSIRAFAIKTGCSHSHVIEVMQGRKRAPLKKIKRWADALYLSGFERDQFVLAAKSDRAKGKTDSSAYVAGLESEVRGLRRSLASAAMVLRSVITIAQERGLEIPRDAFEVIARIEERVNVSA